MKILILAVTTLNFVTYFPYNGSQEIHSKRKQHFSANPPLSNYTASNTSSILETEENSPTEDLNSYSAPLEGIVKITGSPSEGNRLEMIRENLHNFPPSGNDVLHRLLTNWTLVGFAYAKGTVDNPTKEDSPKSNASPSYDAIQDKSSVSSFAASSQITQRRRRKSLSRKSSISLPVSLTYYQVRMELPDVADLDRDSEITESHEHFPSWFASDSATNMQNSMEKFIALADEDLIDTSSENSFLRTGTTTNEEAEQEYVIFIDSTAPIEKGIFTPRRHFGSLTDREMSSEEKSTFYTEVESESEEDVFQETEDIPSSDNLDHFELGYNSFETDGFLDSNTANSLSKLIIIPCTEITISDGDLFVPEEENVDTLYVTSPINKKINFKPMATKTKFNSLDVSSGIKKNIDIGDVEVSTPSNSVHKIERMGYSRPLNTYYDDISKPIIIAIDDLKDPYVTWKTIKNKQLSSTMDNGDIIDLRNGYQMLTDISAKNNDRPANKRTTARNEASNSFHVNTGILNNNLNNEKEKVKLDFPSIIADSPINKYNIKINDFETLKRKLSDLGSASSGQAMKNEEETVFIADSSDPFSPPQATNSVKKLYWAAIRAQKTYSPNNITSAASNIGMLSGSHDAENTLNGQRCETENSFEEGATVNDEADLQNEESIESEEDGTLEKENINYYIYVLPMEEDYIPKEDRRATTHYSMNPDAYGTTTFRRTSQPRAGQAGFQHTENVVSKTLFGKLNPEVPRKMIATDTTSDSNHDELSSDTHYRMIQENVPSIYTFTQETVPDSIKSDSSIPMRGDVNPDKAMKGRSRTNFIASFILVNVAKMPPNTTILSPYPSALESKEGNDNSGSSAPTVEDVRLVGLKSLLIPNQKISRTAAALGGNDRTSYSAVMSQVSEPTEEHWTSIDHDWKVIEDPSAAEPFSQDSAVPLEDLMSFPENIINVADIHTTEYGDNSGDPDSMAFSSDIATQAATHSKRGINQAAGFVSHHVQQTAASPPAEERAASENEGRPFSSNDKAVVEEKFYISGDNIPVNLKELNAMKATLLLLKPVVASAQEEGLENPGERFYPGSTGSTAQLRQVQTRDSLALGSLDQQSTDSSTSDAHFPSKVAFSLLGFTKDKNSQSDPALIMEETTAKMRDNSFIADDLLALSDTEVPPTDDATFIEDLNNTLDGERGIASVKWNDMIQYGAIPFMEDSSEELHMEPEVGENKGNYMDLTTIGLDENTLEFPSNENTFYALEEDRSSTIRKPTIMQRVLHRRIGSPVPFPSTHVSENPSKENVVESKSEQKYNVWFLRGANSDSGNNGTSVQYLPAPFYNKPSGLMTTHFLTNQNGKFSTKISDGFTLKEGSISRREGEDTENINTSDAEPVTAEIERKEFPSKISVPTMKLTKVMGREQLPRKGLSATAFNALWEANGTMPPKSKYNENKASREESYNSRDIIIPSYPGSINTESEFPFVYEDSEAKFLKESSALSHIKKTNTSPHINSLSSAETNEWRGVMNHEENARSGEPLILPTTENINLIPEDIAKHSVLMSDKPLSDYSELESVPTDIIEYIDRIGETNNQHNQVIRRQKGLNRLTFTSTFPHQASANVIRNSINSDADSSSTMKSENTSEMTHSQDSSIPLAEFAVITKDGFSFLDDSEDLGDMASLPFSPVNTMNVMEDALILDTDSSYKGDSVLSGEDNNRSRGSQAQQSSEKHGDIPDGSTEYLETSGQMTSDFLTNTPAAWSDILETKTDYINFINDKNVFIADSNVRFSPPQAKNPVKNYSWAAIMARKTYLPSNTTTTKVGMTADSRDAENTLNSPRYEMGNSFEDDAMLNYDAPPQSEETIESEEDKTLEKENIKDYITVVPMEDDYILKEDRLTTTHYSTNPNVYETTTFRGTMPPRAGQPGFENVVSKHWLGKLNPKVQRKMIARNTNSYSNYDERFSDTTYRAIQENIPNIYAFTQETVPEFIRSDSSIPIRNKINPGKAVTARRKETLIASFNLVNVTKMPPNATILSPYPSALESKEGNDSSGSSAPTVEDVRPVGLKFLFIPNQKISRTAAALGGNDRTSYSAVMSQVSEPTEEHWTSIDHDWKVIEDPSAAEPFSQDSAVPLEDLMSFPENIINVADIHTTEYGDNSGDPDSMAFSSDIATQAATHSKRGINQAAGFVSHHVQQTATSPPAEERATSENEGRPFSSNDKAVVEEKFYISGDNIPVNLKELNAMKATLLLLKPVVASAQEEGLENPGERFYPGSTGSTAQLRQIQTRDSLALGSLDQQSTDSSTSDAHFPSKVAFSLLGFTKDKNSQSDPALIMEETTAKMRDNSFIADDLLALSDTEVPPTDDATFIEDLNNTLDGERGIASVKWNDMIQYGAIPFMEDSSEELHMEPEVGENKGNYMDLTTIGLDENTLEFPSNENTFYALEEDRSSTIRKPTIMQRVLHRRIGSPVPFPSTHVSENPSKENVVESKSEQKYNVWFLRGANSDSGNNGTSVQYLPAPFYNKPSGLMTTHFLTNQNGKFSTKISDGFTLKGGSISRREGEDTENINTSDAEPVTAEIERKEFPSKISVPTMKLTKVMGREQLPRKGLSATAFNALWEANGTMPPKSKYNENKASREESYNSRDIIIPSYPGSINTESEFPFVYEDSEAKFLKESSALSHIKKTNTSPHINSLSSAETNEWRGVMNHEENARSGEPLILPTTENINLIPEHIAKHSVLMSDKPLSDYSELESVPTDIIEYIDRIGETNNQHNQVIRRQKGLNRLTFTSTFPHQASANVIRNSINSDADSSSTMKSENTSEMTHSQDSSIPLAEFAVITKDGFSFLDDSEDLGDMASLPFSPVNTMNVMEDALILDTDSSYKGDSVLSGEDNNRSRGSQAQQSSEKHGDIPDGSTEYLETSGQMTSDFLTNTPAAWSDILETKTDYINFINDKNVFIADSNVRFSPPQAKNPVKNYSWAAIMARKTYLPSNTTTTKVGMTADSRDAENTLNSPRYEMGNSFEDDAMLNYDAPPQSEETIESEEDKTLEKENIKDYITVVPMEDDYILKEDRLTTTHYSTNPNVYETTTFRGTMPPRAGQPGFENVVSKHWLGKLNPKVQRKMIARNTNSYSNYDERFSDTTYRAIQENIPNIYAFTQETVPEFIRSDSSIPIRNKINPGKAVTARRKETLIASFNLVNVTKMPPNTTILSPYPSALESKEGNGSSGSSAPPVEDVHPVGLKFLFIPNQKISRTAAALGGNDRTSYSAVMSQVSEPTEEHWTSIDHDWKVIEDPSAAEPFSQDSAVPLEDLMSFPENIINVADIHTTEYGDNSGDPDSMAFSSDIATQAATHSKRGINQAAGFVSHHVQQTAASPPAEERATSENEGRPFSSNDKAVVEEKFYILTDNIPVNLEELNAMKATSVVPKPVIASAQQKGNGFENPGETFYPGSTLSTKKLIQAQAGDSLPLGNLDETSIDSSTEGSHLPMKMVFSPPSFMENKSSKLLTTKSIIFIPEDLIKNFVIMGDETLSDASALEPEASGTTVFMNLINEPDNQANQDVRFQTGLKHLMLKSRFPHKASVSVIRNFINNGESSFTMRRENTSEMTHSQDSSLPLAEFDVIPNNGFSFTDDSEDVGDMTSLPFSLMNTMHTMEDAIILDTDSSNERESMLPGEVSNWFKGSLALNSSAKRGVISDAFAGYHESSGPLTSESLTYTPPPWSDTFETNTDYIDVINDEEAVFNADSFVPFNLPQARDSVKKLSLASIVAHKTYLPNKTTIRDSKISTKAVLNEAENTLNSPRCESENSAEEDTKLNYEANLQNKESIKSERDTTLEEENIKDYIYVVPMEDDYIFKEDRLATTHYSDNLGAYDTTTFREILQPRAGPPGFENTKNVVSKPQLGKLNPQVQRKTIARNRKGDSNQDELSSGSIYTFTPENVKFIRSDSSIPIRGDVNPGNAMKDRSKETLIASFNLVNVTKMPPNTTILSPYPSALESKEGNDNSGSSAPTVEDVRPVGLKFLLIPNQKISRTAAALGGNDRTSYSAVMSQVSEPTEEHWTSIDHDWKVIEDPSAAEPFSQGSTVPLEDLMFFPENIINVADIHTTEYGDNSGDPDSMAFSSDIATQAATHSKRGINQAAEFVSHHVQQTAASPPAEERAASENEGRPFSSNDKAVVEEKFYISADNIPVNLKELNAMKATLLLLKPVVASTQEEGLENPGERFYPGSTGSTAQLRQVQTRDSLALGSLGQQSTDSSTSDAHFPSKVAFSLLGFTKDKNSQSDPALIMEETTAKMRDNSFIADDLLALSDTEVPSTDDATFIEDLNNTLDGERGIASVKWNDMIQYGAIPFMEDSSEELHMEPEVGENKGNYMDLTTIGLDENTLEFPSNENTFYALEEERSSTIRKPPIMQRVLHRRIGSPVPFPSTHVAENPSKENVVESKSEQKYNVWFLRGANSDSGNNGTSVQYLPAPFYNKPSRLMTTHFLTNQNGKFSTKISDGFTLKEGSISRREGEDTENINTSDAEPVTAEIERKEFPSKISVPTMKLTKVMGREQLPRKGLSATAFNALWEANGTMPPKSKYNENKASREESYNSRDIIIPSYPGSINTESEFPFVYEDSEAKFLKESSALSHIKKTNTSPHINSLSSAETNEWRGVMNHEENARSGEPLILPTTENINLIPEDIAKHSVLMSDKPLSDYSELESVPTDIIEYIDRIGETNNQHNQVIRRQKGLNRLTFTSTFPHQASANVIRNSINSDADSSSTMKSENTSEMTHSQDSSIPLAEFAVITKDGFSFLDDSEDLGDMASLPFSPVNTMNVMEDALILDTDSSYKGDSVLSGEDNNRSRGSQAQQSSKKHGDIPDGSTEYLETSGQMTSDFLTNTPAAWSDILETKTDYINFINDKNVSIADSNVRFSPPQAKNPVKNYSWAAIMARKTYLPSNTTTTKVGMTADSRDAENTLNSPRYEMGNSFEDDAMLNYDAPPQSEETIESEEDKTLEKENIKDYITVVPMEDDYILKEDRLTITHYSTNPNVYETTTFRGTMPPRAGQPGFENVVSKHWLGKLNPKVQRKMIARNTNSYSNYDERFSDTTYRAMQENIPNIYAFTQETVPEFIRSDSSIPIRNKINPGKAVTARRKETLIASFNLVNVTKMPPNATILSPYPSALESKEGNDSSGSSAPTVEDVRPVGLKFLFIPNQKISRTAAALGGNDRTSYSAVMSQVSEPTEEHWTSIDHDWKVIEDPSAAEPFSQDSAVPLEDLMSFPENIINVADIHTTEYGDNSGDPDSMAFSSDIATQAATHSKRGINQAAGFVSHHVQQTAASQPAEERATSENEGRPFSSNDKAVIEEKFYISADNIPVNLKELNAMKATLLLLKPVVASTQEEGLENPGERFYPGSTGSTAQLRQVQTRDSLALGSLGQQSTDSSTSDAHFPSKVAFSLLGFTKDKNSQSDPALIMEETTAKMRDNSFIADDLLALSDTEVPSTDDATFIEDLNNTLDGERGIASVKWNDMIQYGAIPFMEDSSEELHMEPEVGENKGNYMDLTTIGLDENTLEFPSNENTFYALEEERSSTIRKPPIMQRVLHRRIGSPVPFPSTHVAENPSKENVVESKSEQKYNVWFLRGANSDSGNNGTSVQYLPAPFYNKPSRLMTTHFLTNQNGKFSTKISDGFTLKEGSISRREGEDTENINTSDAEPVTAEIERKEFPSKISVPTMKLTKVMGREQLPRKGLSATAFNALWEANGTMPPKSKYNENKASREESYNSRDIIIPSYPGSINTESEFPFVYEDSEAKFLKESSALSHIKKTNTSPHINSLSSAETNEWRGVMNHEENARSGEPLILPTTENINLIPEHIAKHSVLMSDKPLSDYSELESVPTDIIEYIDHIGETNNQHNQVIRCQKGLNRLTFTSTFPHQASANVIRNSINSDADSSSTMKSENTSEMTHSQDSSIPLAEFAVITKDGFSFLDDSEDLGDMASLPFSPVNTMNVMEDALILDTDSSYEGDSVLSGEDNNRSRGSQAQQSSEKHGDIPDGSTEYLETSGQMTSDFLTNTPAAWSDILETKTDYINFINDKNVFIADSNVRFSPPQAKNPVKNYSWAAIMARKTYLPSNTTTTKVGMTADSRDAENTLNSPRYEMGNSFEDDAMLNYDAPPQSEETIESEEDKTLEKENIKDYITVVPMEDDYILKEDRLTTTHYSTNPNVYETTTFRGTMPPRAGQPGFVNVVSKHWLGKLNPKVQRKMIARNTNSYSNYDERFSDTTYRAIQENIPNIYAFTQETVPEFIRSDSSIPIRNKINPGKAVTARRKETLIASFNLVNVTKMPPNATILSPYPSALESKEGNDNSGSSAPTVEDVRPVGLKFLFIPNQKISRTAAALGGNDRTSYSAVMSQVSEPTEEHWTSIDHDWKVIEDPSAAEPFSQGSTVPLEDLMSFPENIINVADIHTTEYGDNSGDPDSMAFSSDIATQAATHSKRGINQAAGFVSHHVQQTAASQPAEERATPENEGRPFSSNDKAVIEEKFYILTDNIPVNLEELNAMKATSVVPKPVIASAQQKGNGFENPGETFYPGSTLSTKKLIQAQAGDSLPLGNLDQTSIDSSTKGSHLPMKMVFSPPGFMENKSSKLLTTKSIIFIPEDLIKNFVIMGDETLSDASALEPEASGTTVFMNLINEPDNQANQDVRFQTGLKHLMLKSRFPHKASVSVIRNFINNGESSFTMRRENTSEMTHSQDSSLPLAEFDVIPNNGFSFTDDSEDVGDMTSLPFSLMNTMHTMEDAIILDTDSSNERESMLPGEVSNWFKGSLALNSSAKRGVISDAFAGYHESSGPLTSESLTYTPPPWSDTFETNTDYIDVINDEEAVFNADSFVPFNLPQARDSVKKLSLASIVAHKTYLPNKTTIRDSKISTKAVLNEAENTLNSPRYESENSADEDTKLNYEANLQNKESIKSEKDTTLEEENIKDYIYVVPMEDDYIFKEDRLATTHYSDNLGAYDTTTFRETLQPRAGPPGFENTKNVVSKPQLGKLNPQVQRKMIARNRKGDSNQDELSSGSIYTFTPENVKFIRSDSSIPIRGDVNPGNAMKDRSKETLIASFNLVNVTKMPPNTTILFPYPSALESKEGNDNSGSSAPTVEDVRPVGLKFLLIPNQKISRTAAALGGNDRTSYSAVMSQVSEPTEEHWTSIDHDWKVIEDPSAAEPFSQGSTVPLEDLMSFPENVINVADIHTTEYGDNSGDPDSMAFSSDIATQAATHSKRGINQAAGFVSHHVQQTAASPPAEERATSENEGRPFSSNDKAVVEEKFYISADNIPVNLEELNAMKATSLLPNPVVASAQQEGLENPGESFYPDSTRSTAQLTRLQAGDSLAFLTLDQPSTDSSPPGFMENKSYELLTTESITFIPEELIKNFVIIGDKPLSDASELEPELSDIIAFMNLINEPDNQDNQVIRLQTG